MEEGTKDICRFCRAEIVLVRETRHWGPGQWFWRHTDVERGQCNTAWDDIGVHCANVENRFTAPGALPEHWCWWLKEDGHYCKKAIRDENLGAHLYACGVHMRKFVQDKEYRDQRQRKAEDEEARKAMEEWELGIYNEAMARLHSYNPALFPNRQIDTMGRTWKAWDRTIKLDIADFERWIRELMAYAPGGGGESSGQDDDSLSGLFEQAEG